MHEKKDSFKAFFAQYYTITVRQLNELLYNTDPCARENIDLLDTKICTVNNILDKHNAFAYINDTKRFEFLCVSESCEPVLGHSPAIWKGKTLSFFVDNYCMADSASSELILKEILHHQNSLPKEQRKNYVYSNTFRFYHKKGYFVWIKSYLTFLHHDTKGKLLYTVTGLQNIDVFKSNDNCTLQIIRVDQSAGTTQVVFSKHYPPAGLQMLSPAEFSILKLLAQGYNNKEIGKALNLHETSIDTYRKRMLKKTWCSNTVELVYYGVRNGLLND